MRLRILSTATSTAVPPIIYDNPEVTQIDPLDWSPDGKWIAVHVRREGRISQIGLFSPDDRSLTVLQSVDWSGVEGLRFSPDSKWLAFHRPENQERPDRDVFVIAVDGTKATAAAATPANERVVGWTPRGDRLLVLSDRGGSTGIWAVPMSQGVPQGQPELVRSDMGDIAVNVLTKDGVLFYNHLRPKADIYLASLDLATGRLSSPSQPVQKYVGSNTLPEWSRDGRFLSYLSRRAGGSPMAGGQTLMVQNLATGSVRELTPKLSYMDNPVWSPDGRSFIARGADLKGGSGIVRIDVETGAAALVAPNEVCSGVPYWAAQGQTFFCFQFEKKHVVEVHAATGEVVRTFPAANGQGLGVSPDGQYLAFWGNSAVELLPLAGGPPRVVARIFGDSLQFRSFSWTPDSRHITFNSVVTEGGERAQWLVPIADGQPRKVDVPVTSFNSLRVNPVTGQVLYSANNQPQYETWKLEHFLGTPAAR